MVGIQCGNTSIPVVDDPILNVQLSTARQQSQQFRSQLQQLSSRLASRRETLRLKEQLQLTTSLFFKVVACLVRNI